MTRSAGWFGSVADRDPAGRGRVRLGLIRPDRKPRLPNPSWLLRGGCLMELFDMASRVTFILI
jgi:hypothetical protein